MLDAEGNQNKGGFTCGAMKVSTGIKCWMLRETKTREGFAIVFANRSFKEQSAKSSSRKRQRPNWTHHIRHVQTSKISVNRVG